MSDLTGDTLDVSQIKNTYADILDRFNSLIADTDTEIDVIIKVLGETEQLFQYIKDLEGYEEQNTVEQIKQLKEDLNTLLTDIQSKLDNGELKGDQGVLKDSFKNFIINGDFRISQRSESFNYPDGLQYSSVDRFKFQRTNQTLVDTEHGKAVRLTGNNTGYSMMETILEDATIFNNKIFTLSFYVRGSEDFTAPVCSIQDTNGNLLMSDKNINITTEFTKVSFVTDNVSNLIENLRVKTMFASLTENQWIDIAKIQLEIGDKATDFEYRFIQIESLLCKRFANLVDCSFGRAYKYGSSSQIYSHSFDYNYPVQMRVNPTVQIVEPIVYDNCSHTDFWATTSTLLHRVKPSVNDSYRAYNGLILLDSEL